MKPLRRKKLITGLVTLTAGAGLLGACAPNDGPPTQAIQLAASVRATQTVADDGAHQAGLVAGEDARLIAVRTALSQAPTGADGLQSPFRIASGGTYTLVLTARKSPYTMSDLIRLETQTLTQLPDKSFLIKENIVVAQGATLELGSTGRATVRLESDARVFTSLVSLGGRLQLQGSAAAPLTITSWDQSSASPDNDLSDGRAYIRAIDGTAAVKHAVISDLGFWSGRTGGLALTGSNRPNAGIIGQAPHDARERSRAARAARKAALARRRNAVAAGNAAAKLGFPAPNIPPVPPVTSAAPSAKVTQPVGPVTGTAVSGEIGNATFTGNAFGLFISDAQGVNVHDSVVQDSLADGIVLHHFVTGTTIDRVISQDNRGDGFILSRGVSGTVLNADTSQRNLKSGFVLSGRPLADGPSAAGQSSTLYGNNELVSSTASNNGRAGVQIISGLAETVQATHVLSNNEGIVVGSGATGTTLSGNIVSGSTKNGITIRDGSNATVTGNTVTGGGNGIVVRDARAELRSNVVSRASLHGLSFVGAVDRSIADDNILSGKGSSAIDLSRSNHRGKVTLTDNNSAGWKVTHHAKSWLGSVLQPMTITLAMLFLIILLGSFRTRRRSGRLAAEQHPYATTRSLMATEESRPNDYIDLTAPHSAGESLSGRVKDDPHVLAPR